MSTNKCRERFTVHGEPGTFCRPQLGQPCNSTDPKNCRWNPANKLQKLTTDLTDMGTDPEPGQNKKQTGEHKEDDMQTELFQTIQSLYAAWPELALLFHIPNGRGKFTASQGKRFKRMGLKRGVSDLFLPVPRLNRAGLWVELKVKPNKPTETQQAWLDTMAQMGYAVSVCYSVEEAIENLKGYLQSPEGETRERSDDTARRYIAAMGKIDEKEAAKKWEKTVK